MFALKTATRYSARSDAIAMTRANAVALPRTEDGDFVGDGLGLAGGLISEVTPLAMMESNLLTMMTQKLHR